MILQPTFMGLKSQYQHTTNEPQKRANVFFVLTHHLVVRMVGVINDLRERVEEQEKLKEDLDTRLDGTMKVLTGVRAGLEHVAEKLEVSLVVGVFLIDPPRCE